jgi:RNA recognition motif-containing protein
MLGSVNGDAVRLTVLVVAFAAPLPIDSTISHDRHDPTSPLYGRRPKVPQFNTKVPIPDKPPYRAHIGNISYDLTEDVVQTFLGNRKVVEIHITRHRDTGKSKACFVEFHTVEDLKEVLDMDGQQLAGRAARIQVAQRRDVQKSDSRGPPRNIPRGGLRKPNNTSNSKSWEPPMPTEESLKARPRLKLKPRSQKAVDADAPASVSDGKANPFGAARPADTASKLAELEVRDLETKKLNASGELDSEEHEVSIADEGKNRNSNDKEKRRANTSRGPQIFKDEPVLTKIAKNPFDLLAEEDE